MGDYLYTDILPFVTVINVSSNPQSIYTCAAFGANLAPANFQLNPLGQQATQGDMGVPNAVIGAQGTYPLTQLRWDVKSTSGNVSTVMLSGTVTYVTVEDPFETTTTQTISVTPQIAPTQIPINIGNLGFQDNGTPLLTLTMNIFAGSVNQGAAEGNADQAAATANATNSMKRVITRKKERAAGDKAEATSQASDGMN
jgi:hypothetical protein